MHADGCVLKCMCFSLVYTKYFDSGMQILGLRAASVNVWSVDTRLVLQARITFRGSGSGLRDYRAEPASVPTSWNTRARILKDVGWTIYTATLYRDPVKARWGKSTVLELKNRNFSLQTNLVNSPCRDCIFLALISLEAKGVFLSCMTVSLIKFGKHQCK